MLYQAENGELSIALVGDAMVSQQLSPYQEPPYLRVVELLRGVDAAFCNLEMPIHDYEYPPGFQHWTYGRSESHAAQELRWMGINMVSTANNHIYDFGEGGRVRTQQRLDEARIVYAGTGENLSKARAPGYLDTRNGRVALLATASSFPEWGKAGEQRPDLQGRPGISFLRYETIHTVDAQAFHELERISQKLGFEQIKVANFGDKYGTKRDEFSFVTSFKVNEAHDFEDVKFVLGDSFRTATRPYTPDVEDILRWVREARRQADWVVLSLHTHECGYPGVGETGPIGPLGLRNVSPDFVREFAQACIEAGADVFVGHGVHVLRGIEIYRGKPIFYSLGEFILQNETLQWLPADPYRRRRLGHEATPADFFDARSAKDTKSYPAEPLFWRSVLALCRFSGGSLSQIELYPLDLGYRRRRTQRGRPLLATEPLAGEVIKQLQELSRPYGTEIRRERELWVVRP